MRTKLSLVLSSLWLLALAVVATIYLAWVIYPWENAYLHLADQVGLPFKLIWKNFNQLMRYLTLPWVNPLAMSDFPSSKAGLAHFRDVKHLFQLAQAVLILFAWPALSFIRKQYEAKSLWLYSRYFLGLVFLPLALAGLGFILGFEQFFTLFHQVLFPGASNWLFDPLTDPVIWALPEEYFLHCFLIFLVIYEAIMLAVWLVSRKIYQSYRKQQVLDEQA